MANIAAGCDELVMSQSNSLASADNLSGSTTDAESRLLEIALRDGLLSAVYAERNPEGLAVADGTRSRTFSALHSNANRLANALVEMALQPGDAVALICSNRVEYVEVLLACQRIGARLTPVNWHLGASETGYIIRDCEAKVLIVEAQFLEQFDDAEMGAETVIVIDGQMVDGFGYEELLRHSPASNPKSPVHGTIMFYTSGTTGRPKGVLRKKASPVPPQREGTVANYREYGDVQLLTGPAYHAAPLLLDIVRAVQSGVPIHMMESWDTRRALALIEEKRITHAHMVPIMFQRLLALPEDVKAAADVSSLRCILHGAAPCAPDVKRAMINWFGPVFGEYYAGSEGSAGFLISSEEWLKKPGSVGRAPDESAVRIFDPDGKLVEPGAEGEIFHRMDPANAFEYFKSPEKNASQIRDGYFTLGDIGRIDEDGYLYLTGRSAECIISGGVNIYPREIDEVLASHEAVEDVCVIGAPNEEWGEEVRAVVQLCDGCEPSDALAEAIRAHAKESLSGFKVPRSVDFIAELPRLPSGKVPRAEVRKPYWRDRERQI